VSHDQPFKTMHGYRRECYGSVVLKHVENVSEDTCKLVSTCSQYKSWYSVWRCGLVNVDLSKDLNHIVWGERDQSSVTAGALMHVSVLYHDLALFGYRSWLPTHYHQG
jgi:hypothetical protein